MNCSSDHTYQGKGGVSAARAPVAKIATTARMDCLQPFKRRGGDWSPRVIFRNGDVRIGLGRAAPNVEQREKLSVQFGGAKAGPRPTGARPCRPAAGYRERFFPYLSRPGLS